MERPSHEGPTVPMTPGPEKASIVEDFMDIFYAPARVFARREKSGFGLHLLIVTVLCALFIFANRGVMSQIMDAQFQKATAKAIAASPQAADQIKSMVGVQEKVAGVIAYAIAPLAVFFTAFFLWIVGKLTGVKLTFGQVSMVMTLAFVPRIVGFLATTLQVVLTDTSNLTEPAAISLSPARFMNPDGNAKLLAFLLNFDVFAIWSVVLIGIGLATVAKVPRAKGYLTSAIVFLLFSLPSLLR